MNIIPLDTWSNLRFWGKKTAQPDVRTAVVLHHSVTSAPDYSVGDGKETEKIKEIENIFKKKSEYVAIAYNFIITPNGNIYEGRGWDCVNGANVPRLKHMKKKYTNTKTVSVCFVGDFRKDVLSDDALKALVDLIVAGSKDNRFTSRVPDILGHCDLSDTKCPGSNIYARIKAIKKLGIIYLCMRA